MMDINTLCSSIHSVLSLKTRDFRSAMTLCVPGKCVALNQMLRSMAQTQIWCETLLHWGDLLPPIALM